jgi:hypothetical protein
MVKLILPLLCCDEMMDACYVSACDPVGVCRTHLSYKREENSALILAGGREVLNYALHAAVCKPFERQEFTHLSKHKTITMSE